MEAMPPTCRPPAAFVHELDPRIAPECLPDERGYDSWARWSTLDCNPSVLIVRIARTIASGTFAAVHAQVLRPRIGALKG